MYARVFIAICLLVVPALANPRQFDIIQVNQSITVALPAAQCEAKVVSRTVDQLTLILKSNTPCGKRNSIVTLARTAVDDVIDERPPGGHLNGSISPAGYCTTGGTTLVAMSAGQLSGETKGTGVALAVTAAGGAVSAVLCHVLFSPRTPRYTVFASQLTPRPTPAKVP